MTTNGKGASGKAPQETIAATSDIYNVITIVEADEILTTTYRDSNYSKNSPAPENCNARSIQEVPVVSLDDAERVFAGLYENQHAAVIQGRYVGDEQATGTDGLIKTQHYATENFVDRLSNIVTLGVWVGEELADLDKAMLKAIGRLPEMFHGLEFLWSMKPRTGIKKRTVYLTFWLPMAMTMEQVRKALKAKKFSQREDRDLFPSPDKLIITANPVFENGIVDSVPVRRGRCVGKVSGGILDTLTVVECLAPLVLTKTFHADGTVTPYAKPKNVKFKPAEITGWDDLRALLARLHAKPKSCLIRGKQTGYESEKPGTFFRRNENFSDQPLHWAMVDVDGFEPGFAMPTDPAAVDEFIEAVLPDFKGASYYWHMSSSAGQSPKLKCHIHFLLKNPCTSAQLKAWALGVGKQVDSAIYQPIQCNYTADPIYEEGREDPVAVRAGFHQGERDFVDLVITAEARETGAGEGGGDMKLVDPSEKPGIIGLFHRTYSAEQVLLELLEGFEQVSERRYTWHGGGGTPEGVWVHDRGMHVGSSHNTWPINGIANLWDTVRILKFGDLDVAEDDFDQLDINSREIQAKPSHVAMLEWAGQLPEIKEANRAEQEEEAAAHQSAVTSLLEKITAAKTVPELTGPIAAEAKTLLAEQSDQITKARIDSAIQARAKKLDGANLPIAAVRALTQSAPVAKQGSMLVDAGDQLGMAKALKNGVFLNHRREQLAVRANSSWYVFNGQYYKELPDDEKINNTAWKFLPKLTCRGEDGVFPLCPSKGLVAGVVDALRAVLETDIELPPAWMPGTDGPDPANLLVMANGILDITTGELLEHTPRLFAVNALPYDFNAEAECPQFMAFLEQVLPGDPESQRLLQEWFGYCLTADTSQQKFLMAIGQKRSGKGTVGRTLQAMLGNGINTIGPTLASLSKDFGLEHWVGKLVAVFGDTRSGGKEPQTVVERILSIVGEDTLTVGRKHRSDVTTRLPTRIVILSNEILRLGDASGAMVGRMLLVEFGQTFYGREDTTLETKLIRELPGILNWALAGKRRLAERGHFVQPERGKELLQESHDVNSPMTVFVREHCDLDPMLEVGLDLLFEAWRVHCSDENHHIGDKAQFSKNLKAGFPEIKKARPRDKDNKQYTAYYGIDLKIEMLARLKPLSGFE